MSTVTDVARPERRTKIDPSALHRFSVANYHAMMDAGILNSTDRVELLEGWIVHKMTQYPPHASSVGRIIRWLGRILPEDWSLRCQAPITLSDSEPEPDIALARGEEGTYDSKHPKPADIGVLMEVADSTFITDRRYKGELYAQAKIVEFWLVNLVERKIEVYTSPRGGKYQKKLEYTESESVPLMLDRVKIADVPVSELMAKP